MNPLFAPDTACAATMPEEVTEAPIVTLLALPDASVTVVPEAWLKRQ